jgi:NAD(P) transhydrogenase subunit alpha
MRLAVLKERREGETRVAATPETVRKLVALGLTVAVEAGAGAGASIPDADFAAAGAEIAASPEATLSGAGVIFAVQPPVPAELALVPRGALMVCISGAMADRATVQSYAKGGIDVAAMELLPRITRAQSMDILSSQANLAGYRAVIEGAGAFDRGFPMMMTAAGTVPPARVFVVGAGVAGLQAIATARRLGAIVSATDVRPAAKEEIKSLGATFVGVEDTETAGQTGAYAKEMSADFRRKQAELMTATVAKNDMVICTALVQGGRAPVLVTQAMVDGMRPGSVIVDIAADGGGNCEATHPGEAYVTANGVKILGYRNWPGRISVAASTLYAKNLLTFLTSFWDKEAGAPRLPEDDAIVQGVMLTRGGVVVHANFAQEAPAAGPPGVSPGESETNAGGKAPPEAEPERGPELEHAPAPVTVSGHAAASDIDVPAEHAAEPASGPDPAEAPREQSEADTSAGPRHVLVPVHVVQTGIGLTAEPASSGEPAGMVQASGAGSAQSEDGHGAEESVQEMVGVHHAEIDDGAPGEAPPIVAAAPQPIESADTSSAEPTMVGSNGGELPEMVSESASLPGEGAPSPQASAEVRARRRGGRNRANQRPNTSNGDTPGSGEDP